MKTAIAGTFCLVLAISYPSLGQTGAGSPGIAPTQAGAAQPRTPAGSEKNRTRPQKKRGPQSATVAPNDVRTDAHVRPKPVQRAVMNYVEAVNRQHRERHDRTWWKSHFTTIVFVTGCGYYYWDAGYWFPAWGYDPRYETYESDGPIYTYGNLLPDQVIYNVQRALKEAGYYAGPLTASLSANLRRAIAAFQEDNGLDATGAIDAPTVEALGLY